MLPFSPQYEFKAYRALTINGVSYARGDVIDKSALGARRLQQLYELRRIEPVIPSVEPEVPVVVEPEAPAKKAK